MIDSDKIAVRLIDEGIDVWVVVSALHLGGEKFQILHDIAPDETEQWEFEPGDCVRCELKLLSGGLDSQEYWCAIQRA